MYRLGESCQAGYQCIVVDSRLPLSGFARFIDIHVPGDRHAGAATRQSLIEADHLFGDRPVLVGHRLGGSSSYDAIGDCQSPDIDGMKEGIVQVLCSFHVLARLKAAVFEHSQTRMTVIESAGTPLRHRVPTPFGTGCTSGKTSSRL